MRTLAKALGIAVAIIVGVMGVQWVWGLAATHDAAVSCNAKKTACLYWRHQSGWLFVPTRDSIFVAPDGIEDCGRSYPAPFPLVRGRFTATFGDGYAEVSDSSGDFVRYNTTGDC